MAAERKNVGEAKKLIKNILMLRAAVIAIGIIGGMILLLYFENSVASVGWILSWFALMFIFTMVYKFTEYKKSMTR